MIRETDVVQIKDVKYKGEPLECTNCSHSMRVVDIVYDFMEGKLEYLTLVQDGRIYPNLNYASFCTKVYNPIMDLVDYSLICNNVLRGIHESVVLGVGENITYNEKQEKTLKYDKGRIVISGKSLRLSRDGDSNRVAKNVAFILGNI